MTFRTSWNRFLGEPLHPVRIALAAVAFGIVFSLAVDWLLHRPSVHHWLPILGADTRWSALLPFILAGGIRVHEGMLAFSGKEVAGEWTGDHTAVILGMLLTYVAGPALFLWGLRARKRWLAGNVTRPSANTILLLTGVGCFFMLSTIPFSVVGGPRSWYLWQEMRRDAQQSAARDVAMNCVIAMGRRAQIFRALPIETGGKAWSLSAGGVTLQDLEATLPSIHHTMRWNGSAADMRFFLEVASPDSLTIWSVAESEGQNREGSFLNKDGRKGLVQVSVGVNPVELKMRVDN